MTLAERSLTDVLAAFRSAAPTPGGGSASALAGALGASLLAMVGTMPRRRAASDAEVAQLEAAARLSAELSQRLTELIDRDSQAYDLVVSAFKLPKESDAEKAVRAARIQEALRSAIDVPLEVMRRCSEAIGAGAVVAAFGNPNAASDVGVALELLVAAARGARFNVDANLSGIRDAAYAAGARREADTLEAQGAAAAAAARAQLANAPSG